jgi:hypothetical protein
VISDSYFCRGDLTDVDQLGWVVVSLLLHGQVETLVRAMVEHFASRAPGTVAL